ncbi:MAG: hypothetical protein ACJASV_002888 [Pseudorhodobacter sp.]|jgi:hypothetical protein
MFCMAGFIVLLLILRWFRRGADFSHFGGVGNQPSKICTLFKRFADSSVWGHARGRLDQSFFRLR